MRNCLIISISFFFLKTAVSQIIGNLPTVESYTFITNKILDFPQVKNKQYGIGNYGFNTIDGFFNPNYSTNKSTFTVRTSAQYSKSDRDYVVRNGSNIVSKNEKYFVPNFAISYKINDIQINITYTTSVFLNQTMNEPSQYLFSTNAGQYSYTFNPTFFIKNEVMQLSGSYRLKNNYAISAGILSNNFNYDVGKDNVITLQYSNPLFTNFQFLGSLNYNNQNDLSLYLLLKSQSALNSMDRNVSGFDKKVIWDKEGIVSFPGEIAYGIQKKIIPFMLSLEIIHEYLYFNDKEVDGKKYTNVFNTEIVAGTNLTLFDSFLVGFLASYYLIYDTRTNYPNPSPSDEEAYIRREKPILLGFSGRYVYSNFIFDVSYQYSLAKYILNDTEELWALRDSAHFFTVGISFNL